MKSAMTISRLASWAIAAGMMLGAAGIACADDYHRGAVEHGGPQHYARPPGAPPHQFLDNRYNHGHYYPYHGYVVHELPYGYRPYYWHGSRYYFYGGVWYAPGPAGFVVVGPPAGLFLATLPPFYTTLWVGGVPYYYANDVYYQWNAAQNGYVVVNPPPGADQPGTPPPDARQPSPGMPDSVYIYPKNGQTPEQQAADRFECHDWARNQTGFDPTQNNGGVSAEESASKRGQYQRAMGACLEARGYSVK